ncbi:MAG: MGMT family protein [Candidatus Desantisbacteria bacterium]
MAKKKTAKEKLEDSKGLPKIVDTPKGVMVVPKPLDVDGLIRKVKLGSLMTTDQIRVNLAKKAEADYACPLATGIFIRVAAEAAEEDLLAKKEPTPYWRVIKPDGSLNEKFPGGIERQASRLREEGHTVIPGKGKKPPKVANFEKYLQELT